MNKFYNCNILPENEKTLDYSPIRKADLTLFISVYFIYLINLRTKAVGH